MAFIITMKVRDVQNSRKFLYSKTFLINFIWALANKVPKFFYVLKRWRFLPIYKESSFSG